MEIDFDNLEVKRKINLLAEICNFGVEWNRDIDEKDNYILGGVETTAFIVSCCIVQWFGMESCGTAETRDCLLMAEAAKSEKKFSIEKWEFLIKSFLKNMVKDN